MTSPYVPIGIMGLARSGKDTTAQILVNRLGYERIAFADKIREALLKLDPWIPFVDGYGDRFERLSTLVADVGWDEAKNNPEVRRLLQKMGTEVGRDMIGRDIWITLAFDQMSDKPPVFTDVRFASEAAALRRLGGVIVEIRRPGAGLQGETGKHSSETEQSAVASDYVIDNDSTLDVLDLNVRSTMARILINRSFSLRHGG